jgi:hypothetical protein
MLRPFNQGKAMPLRTQFLLGVALCLFASFAIAQNTVEELLDAGAKKLSPDEFRQDVAQRTLEGSLTAAGGRMELIYTAGGMVRGVNNYVTNSSTTQSQPAFGQIDGVWNIDDSGRICTSMIVGRTFLPLRCQYWFKLKDDYFLADSDLDPKSKVLRRTLVK